MGNMAFYDFNMFLTLPMNIYPDIPDAICAKAFIFSSSFFFNFTLFILQFLYFPVDKRQMILKTSRMLANIFMKGTTREREREREYKLNNIDEERLSS